MELLRTPRLLLRRWEESDLPAFYDLYSRDDVMRWLGSHPRRTLATLDEARERLDRWHARERDLDPPLGLWAIVPLVTGTPSAPPVGTVPLLPLSDADGPTGLTEVGWHLHPQHQGQGLATEAAGALLAAAATARIGDVLALTDLDNVRSQAVAIHLGMTDEGTTDRWFGLTSRQFRKVKDKAEQYAQQHPDQAEKGEDAIEQKLGIGEQHQAGQGQGNQGQDQQGGDQQPG